MNKKNYLITSASVYEGTRTDGQKYHWAMCSLWSIDGINPNVLPVMPIMLEEEAKLFWQYATASPNTEDRRLRERKGIAVADFNFKAASEAYNKAQSLIKEGKATSDTPCVRMMPVFEDGELKMAPKANMFFMKQDVVMHEMMMPPGNWARIATRTMQVTVLGEASPRTIKPGEPIPGKNGQIVFVQKVRIPMQVDANEDFVEDPDLMLQRLLERNYKRMDIIPNTAPGAQPSEVPAQTNPDVKADAIAAANALGMTIQPGLTL